MQQHDSNLNETKSRIFIPEAIIILSCLSIVLTSFSFICLNIRSKLMNRQANKNKEKGTPSNIDKVCPTKMKTFVENGVVKKLNGFVHVFDLFISSLPISLISLMMYKADSKHEVDFTEYASL